MRGADGGTRGWPVRIRIRGASQTACLRPPALLRAAALHDSWIELGTRTEVSPVEEKNAFTNTYTQHTYKGNTFVSLRYLSKPEHEITSQVWPIKIRLQDYCTGGPQAGHNKRPLYRGLCGAVGKSSSMWLESPDKTST